MTGRRLLALPSLATLSALLIIAIMATPATQHAALVDSMHDLDEGVPATISRNPGSARRSAWHLQGITGPGQRRPGCRVDRHGRQP